MKAIELENVGATEWNAVIAGETDSWGNDAANMSWASKRRHVGVVGEDGTPLALAGATHARIKAGGRSPFEVVGIGGVIVTHSMRGQGLARAVVEAIMDLAREMGPELAMLFCRTDLTALYARFGFTTIEAPVSAEQPGGRVQMPPEAMWAPLAAGAIWPAGEVEVLGEPF